MNKILLSLLLLLWALPVSPAGQTPASIQREQMKKLDFLVAGNMVSSANPEKLKVFVAIYERGPAYRRGTPIFQQPTITEHIAHHEALGDKLIAAGPLKILPEDKVVGVIVLEAEGDEEAQRWFRKDPAIVGKVLSGIVRQLGDLSDKGI